MARDRDVEGVKNFLDKIAAAERDLKEEVSPITFSAIRSFREREAQGHWQARVVKFCFEKDQIQPGLFLAPERSPEKFIGACNMLEATSPKLKGIASLCTASKEAWEKMKSENQKRYEAYNKKRQS